jgi:N-acetylglucosamine kinase-like BadF-type ATPase
MARTSFARRTQRTIVGAAKSGAASVQKTVLKAATAAATAAAQAAVESVIHSMEARESQTQKPAAKRRSARSRRKTGRVGQKKRR